LHSCILTFLYLFAGVGTVGAMEILHEFPGEGLEGLKKFKLVEGYAQLDELRSL